VQPTSVTVGSNGHSSVIVRLGLVCDPRTGANQFVTVVYPLRDSLLFLHDVIRHLSTDVTSPSFPPLYRSVITVHLSRIL
jgi:hypothetical protein